MEEVAEKRKGKQAAEMGFHGRPPPPLPRQPTSQKSTTITATTTRVNKVEVSNQELNGKLKSRIFFDKGRVSENEGIDELYGSKDDADVDVAFSKTLILQSSNESTQVATTENESNGLARETKQDETELYLDHVYNKPVAHQFFCPNCNSCIEKVIVRDWEIDSIPNREPIHTFRCSSCFSFLSSAGNWLFRNFAPNEEGRSNEQETSTVQDPSIESLMESVPFLGRNHDKNKPEPNEILQDERSHAPLSNTAPLPGHNVAYPKPGSAEKEEVEGGEVSSIDAIGDANTETSTVQDPSAEPLMENIPLLGTNRDKTKPKPNDIIQDERAHSPPTNVAPLPGDSVAYPKPDSTEKEAEISGEVSSTDAITNENTDSAEKDVEIGGEVSSIDAITNENRDSPEKEVEIGGEVSSTDAITNENTDSTEKEVEIGGEVSSMDAITNENTDDKYLENIEPDESLTIQADSKENVKTKKNDTAEIEAGLPPSSSAVIVNVDEDTQTLLPSESRDDTKVQILKSIVYGGLTESITSLSVVTSAASADATTLNIVALALANLVGGLFMIAHHLRELRNEQSGETSDQTNEGVDRYVELLGQRKNFIVHATVAVLSFIIFGLVPPVVYGFSFLKSDNKDYKLAAVAAASLLCITMLAIAKAYVRKPPKNYIKTVMYYAAAGFLASGVSYIAGEIIRKIIENFGWFNSRPAITSIADASSGPPEWVSY